MIHGFRTSLQRKKKLVQKVNEGKTKKSKGKAKSKYSDKTGMNISGHVHYISDNEFSSRLRNPHHYFLL